MKSNSMQKILTLCLIILVATSYAFAPKSSMDSIISRSHLHSQILFSANTNQEPCTPKAKFVKRSVNTFVIGLGSLLGTNLKANAGFFSSEEQDKIDALAAFQRPINDLLDMLKPSNVPNALGVYSNTQILKGGKEDSDVVLNYLSGYITPMEKMMEALAPKLKLAEEDQKNAELQPLLMKGHIAELTQAIAAMTAKDQLREVEEVQETLAIFLKLASTKYNVQPFLPSRPLTDAELFGPLGCEFWGKKRAPGSNACIDKE